MHKPHYAWAVCAACALLIFCIWGICATSFSIFNPYLVRVAHLSNAQVSLIPSIRMIFVCVGLAFCRGIHTKLGLRASASVALWICAAALLVYAFSSSALLYYLASAMVGFGYGIGTSMLISLLLPRWFHSHMALAMGICSSTSGVSSVIFPPLLVPVMDRYSLRTGLLICAGVVALSAVAVPAVIRNHPRDLGLTALEDPEETKKERTRKMQGIRPKSAVYLAIAAYALFSGIATSGCSQLPMLYEGTGYTSTAIARVMMLNGACLTVGKILYGKLEDRFGNRVVGLGAFALEIAGGVLMCLSRNHVAGYAGAALYALGLPLSTVGIPLFAEDLSSPEEYEKTAKTMNLIMFICGLLIAPLSGILADVTGSYVPSYAAFTAMTALAAVMIAAAYFMKPAAQ